MMRPGGGALRSLGWIALAAAAAVVLGACEVAPEGRVVVATGAVEGGERVEGLRTLLLDDPPRESAGSGPGPYRFELRDGKQVLATHEFALRPTGAPEIGLFFEIFPFVAGTREISLLRGEQELATRPVSERPPVVTVIRPNGGETVDGPVTIRWVADDPDGDALRFEVLYSPDGGTSWSALATNLQATTFDWDPARTPGSEDARIRVIAADGANTGEDRSDRAFTVTAKGPELVVLAPEEGVLLPLEVPVEAEAVAHDAEDGPIEEIAWRLDGDPLPTGPRVPLSELGPGPHTLTAEVSDSDGNAATESVGFDVMSAPDEDGDGVSDDVDLCPTAYDPAQGDLDGDGRGDACDDGDGDGYRDAADNCPEAPNDQTDADGDALGDQCDSCVVVANPEQVDADDDGYGNACDADLNQDGFVGGPDFSLFLDCFNAPAAAAGVCAAADLNADGFVGGPDFSLLLQGFNQPPGPSAFAP